MSDGFQVGQKVRLSVTARVAEVGGTHAHRDASLVRLEDGDVPLGWVDPEEVGLEVIAPALPTAPGMYWRGVTDPEGQAHMGKWHTDGREFHYLNAGGLWVDVGWGQPSPGDTLNGPLYEHHGTI